MGGTMRNEDGGTSRRRAVVLRHVAFEDLGVLEPLLRERGYVIGVLDPMSGEPVDGDLLVVLGGPIGVYDDEAYPFLGAEKRIVRDWLDLGRPLLGVCLGAQLVAEALGADVAPTGRTEIGFAPLALTDAGRESVLAPLAPAGAAVPVLHWHGDQFSIPAGAVRLAETPGFPNQAFAVGSDVLALQFHLEADHRRIEEWLVGHAVELAAAGVDPRDIRRDARRHGPALEAAALAVFCRWLDGLSPRDR